MPGTHLAPQVNRDDTLDNALLTHGAAAVKTIEAHSQVKYRIRPFHPDYLMVLKGMMVDLDDIPHLLGWNKSLKSTLYVMKVVGRHLMDRLRHPRGTRLLMGNALIGRLLLSQACRASNSSRP